MTTRLLIILGPQMPVLAFGQVSIANLTGECKFTNGSNDLTQTGSSLVFENNQDAVFSRIY